MLEKGYGASLIGKYHVRIKKRNQDAYLVSNTSKFKLAVVCDGLGTKKYSHIGSRKLCRVIHKQIKKCFKNKTLFVNDLIPLLQKKWRKSLWPIKPSDADTTCIFAIISEKNILMCQVGDGLCAFKENNSTIVLSEKKDDFSNETVAFYKSNISNWKIQSIKKEDNNQYKLLLCTDGISEDLKIEFLGEFIDELVASITKNKKNNNPCLVDLMKRWPNQFSNDDKTMVVIK